MQAARLGWEDAVELAVARLAAWGDAPEALSGYDAGGCIAAMLLISARGWKGMRLAGRPPVQGTDHGIVFDVIDRRNDRDALRWMAAGTRVEALCIAHDFPWPFEQGEPPHRLDRPLLVCFPWHSRLSLPVSPLVG